ncbi:hypothetical protein MUK42_35356 [Musa troglodytarum]|uniref:Uncharacterized protein n=1 Tax=Musa troglodytarum TaxID=320322 RepID=A0A9E7EDX9_9LILI|nr:hypothetical protein MUK42_35356 [Musa troglodytarum]
MAVTICSRVRSSGGEAVKWQTYFTCPSRKRKISYRGEVTLTTRRWSARPPRRAWAPLPQWVSGRPTREASRRHPSTVLPLRGRVGGALQGSTIQEILFLDWTKMREPQWDPPNRPTVLRVSVLAQPRRIRKPSESGTPRPAISAGELSDGCDRDVTSRPRDSSPSPLHPPLLCHDSL